MSDSTEIVPVSDNIQALQKFDDKAFDVAAKAGDWLPRLQLMTSSAKECKAGKFPINHYALVKGTSYIDLGTEVNVYTMSWRPKALEMGQKVISVYDVKHSEFERIAAKSAIQNSGCMYGVEFLVFIPSINTIATFFMGSKSARIEAPSLRARMYQFSNLGSQHIAPKGSTYDWYTPLVLPCSATFGLPSEDEQAEQITKFQNPPELNVETAEEADSSGSRAV